ncbi:hypothetical protein F4804DRAFT_313363 [Jackrogersella minutella]|nr:hypothetical protein F4804DRAFT_313363 [Jackrogersella minutella]
MNLTICTFLKPEFDLGIIQKRDTLVIISWYDDKMETPMISNKVIKKVEERAAQNFKVTNVSDHLQDGSGENTIIPPIVSDVLRSHLDGSPRASLSYLPYKSHPQSSITERKVQNSPTSTSLSPLKSSKELAVHVKKLPSSSASQPRRPGRGRPPKDRSREPQSGPKITTPKKGAPALPLSTQNEVGGLDSQPKKRGRPKGWKFGMSYKDVKEGGEGDAKPSEPKKIRTGEPKRRGRPSRPLPPSVRDRYLRSNAEYIPFLCEWQRPAGRPCPAELQNMKTLRKHVYIVHGDEEPLVCRWGKCASESTPIQFSEQTEFQEHMEKAHFRSFVWHLGDGYQNDGISTLKRDADELPRYLFDGDGKQVTPSVTEQQFEDDQQYKERKRKLKRLLILQDENAPSEEDFTKQTLGIA